MTTVAAPPLPVSAVHASERNAKGGLAALSLAMLLSSLGTSMPNASLPALGSALNTDFESTRWVVLAYLVVITACSVSAGRFGDRFGRKRLLIAGAGLYALASLLCGLASGLDSLVLARGLQGLGATAMMALSVASVGEAVSANRQGRAMGLLGTMSALGTAVGPSLGGFVISAAGWRALFLVLVPFGLAAALLSHRFLPEPPVQSNRGRRPVHPLASALLALALATFALAMTGGTGRPRSTTLGLLVVSAASIGLFAGVEWRAPEPLLSLESLRNRTARAGLAGSALISAVMMTTLTVGPYYLAGALGLTPALSGLVLSAGPLVAALASAPAGRLVDRLGAARLAGIGIVGIAGGCAMLAALPRPPGIMGYLACLVPLTLCYALFQTANNSAVMAEVSPEQRGLQSGLLNLTRNLGLITGASVMGSLFALSAGETPLLHANPDSLAFGLRVTFGAAAALALAALVLHWRAHAFNPPRPPGP